MIIYIVPFVLIILFALMELLARQDLIKIRSFLNIIFLIICLYLAFFLGNRKLTGTDSLAYKYIYETNIGFDRLEEGYKWISILFQSHNYSFWDFQLFLGIVTVIVAYLGFILWDQNSEFLQLLVFYSQFWYFMSFNGMRQGIASSFVYLGAVFLLKINKSHNWFFKILAGCSFFTAYNFQHMSMTIISFVILIWLLNKLRIIISGNLLKILSMFLIPILLVKPPIYGIQSALIFLSKFGLDYTSLLNVSGSTYEMANKGLLFILLLLIMLICFEMPAKDKGLINYFPLFIFTLLLLLLIFGTGMNSMRVFDYFMPIVSLFIKPLLEDDKESNKVVVSTIIVFMLIVFVFTLLQNTHQIMPYLGWS
jgi:hypothetical protein